MDLYIQCVDYISATNKISNSNFRTSNVLMYLIKFGVVALKETLCFDAEKKQQNWNNPETVVWEKLLIYQNRKC